MKTSDFFDLLAVVIATAVAAFLIVACWSLFGGLVTYIIAMLLEIGRASCRERV